MSAPLLCLDKSWTCVDKIPNDEFNCYMKTQANSIRFQIRFQILLARNSNTNPRDKPVVGFLVSIDPAERHHGCEVVSRVGI